ncbi:mercuric transport protein MerTP [Salegentibacter sp. JZCK2]|uniref:mercuric transport protein MerTP n=1 Tax=Salegentibacter tibetensis TaxID=2873600 RepID=UPI001CCF5ED1|nr:mercuric transport protein MerTP [Salegentibacter tibetensis]MBZ9730129.1 mercuric transport protein MerTP [Salegentibacter tibetensis]
MGFRGVSLVRNIQVAGTGSLTGNFSWLEPFRWPLVVVSILALGLAWYLKIKPTKSEDCGCDTESPTSFFQSKTFLGGVTVFVILSLSFPYYSEAFYPSNEKEIVFVQEQNIQTVEYLVSGMTCAGCEGHVKSEVNKLNGIVSCQVSYEEGNTIVKFDSTLTNVGDVKIAIERTGYKVTNNPEQ